MTEEERYCSFDIAFLVHKMNVERFEAVNLNGSFVVWELINLRFLFPPIIFVLPVSRQAFYICQWRAIVPARLFELVWKFGSFELLGQGLKLAIWNRDRVGLDRSHGLFKRRAGEDQGLERVLAMLV